MSCTGDQQDDSSEPSGSLPQSCYR